MKLFISWSGEKSLGVANALKDWLPMFNSSLQTFLSKADIEKGSRWASEVSSELADTQFGLICLTKENLSAPWIIFESGSLSKAFDEEGRVFTFLLDVPYESVKGPLGQFQHTRYDKDDFFKMLTDMSRAISADSRSSEQKRKAFDSLWPHLQDELEKICKLDCSAGATVQQRDVVDLISDLHADVRAHRRDLQALSNRVNEISQYVARPVVGGLSIESGTLTLAAALGGVGEFPLRNL